MGGYLKFQLPALIYSSKNKKILLFYFYLFGYCVLFVGYCVFVGFAFFEFV